MKNKFEVRGDITAIFLEKKDGTVLETIIDTADLPKARSIGDRRWYAIYNRTTRGYYARCNIIIGSRRCGRKWESVMLHRLLMDVKSPEMQVDHINHRTLDNRHSANLRHATQFQNSQNKKGPHRNNTSGFRNVTWNKGSQKWHVRVGKNYKRIHIGYFSDLDEAVMAAGKAIAKHMPFSKEARIHGVI